MNKEINTNKIADEIAKGVFELNAITYEYLLHHEERMQAQWQSRQGSLTKLLSEIEFKGTEGRVVLDRIRQNHKSLKSLFSQLVENYERHRNSKKEIALELEEILAGRLLVKSQTMVSDAFQLSVQSQVEIVAAQQRATLLITVFVVLMIAIMATVLSMFGRSVAKPITKLHEGIEIIGSGNLNHRVGTTAKDEIGRLSRAFDQMMEKRRQADDKIKRLNEELEQRVVERTAQLEAANLELQSINEELQVQQEELQVQQKELLEANLKLQGVSRAKSDFLANMSHELRTPLNSVIGFSEVLQDELYGELNEKQLEYARDIHASGKHLLNLINDILDLSKVEAGKMEFEISRFSLMDILNTSTAMLREKAIKHNIKLTLDIAPEADMEIEADERKLKQIMFNLLSNAVKFTPEGGSVHVHARKVRSSESGVRRQDK